MNRMLEGVEFWRALGRLIVLIWGCCQSGLAQSVPHVAAPRLVAPVTNDVHVRIPSPGGHTNSGSFNVSGQTNPNSFDPLRANDVFRISYNMNPGGGRERVEDAALGLEFETHYAPSTTDRWFELHLAYVGLDGGLRRPWTWFFSKASDRTNEINRIEHALWVDRYSMHSKGGGNQWLVFKPLGESPESGGQITLNGPTVLEITQNNYVPFYQRNRKGASRALMFLDGEDRLHLGANGDPVLLSERLIWSADGAYDIGEPASARPRHLRLAGDALVSGRLGVGTDEPGVAADIRGTVRAERFEGSGAGLTNVPAARLQGRVAEASLPSVYAGGKAFESPVRFLYKGGAAFEVATQSHIRNLNADFLDGVDSSAFVRKNAPQTLSGELTFTGRTRLANTGNVIQGSFFGEGSGITNLSGVWLLNGNRIAGAGAFFGSLDAQPVEFRAGGERVLTLEPVEGSPNIIGGSSWNRAGAGVRGAVVGGGGMLPGADGSGPNSVEAEFGVVSGGVGNRAGAQGSGGFAVVSGGRANVAGGEAAVVPGGFANRALGQGSFAAGMEAGALHAGSFVWSDAGGGGFESHRTNEFAVRATGGVRLVTGVGPGGEVISGVTLEPGSGSWSMQSDAALKRNAAEVDRAGVLERLAAVPIRTWSYVGQPEATRHIGPSAQDFHRAFGLGENDRQISAVDADGVALASVQALYELVQQQGEEIRRLRAQLDRLEKGASK